MICMPFVNGVLAVARGWCSTACYATSQAGRRWWRGRHSGCFHSTVSAWRAEDWKCSAGLYYVANIVDHSHCLVNEKHTHTNMHIMHLHTCMHVHACMRTHTHIHTHAHVHTHTQTYHKLITFLTNICCWFVFILFGFCLELNFVLFLTWFWYLKDRFNVFQFFSWFSQLEDSIEHGEEEQYR